jgi:hypothetical protein
MSFLTRWVAAYRGWLAGRPFERAAADPEAAQIRFLRKLVAANAKTVFGQDHAFAQLLEEEDDAAFAARFAEHVPVRDYEGHRAYIDRLIAGESNILTREPHFMFTTTSGTTCEPKMVPVTERWRKSLGRLLHFWIGRCLRDHPGMLDDKILTVVSPAIEGYTDLNVPFGSVSGLTQKKAPWVVRRNYALPYSVSEIEDYELRYRVAARLAIEQHISLIVTPNPSTLFRLAETGSALGATLVDAVREGKLGLAAEGLSESQQAILDDLDEVLTPNPTRADVLQAILDKHGSLLPRYYWPTLRLIGCWLGGTSGVQAGPLVGAFGESVAFRDIGFRATEATFTVPLTDKDAAGPLALHSNFYEFIPIDEVDRDQPSIRLAHELQDGEQYYILVTTTAGLYRYDIHDIVEVQGFYKGAACIAFVRKGRDMANITGEKLHVNQVIAAANQAAKQTGVTWHRIQTIPDALNKRYDLLLETVDEVAPNEAMLTDFGNAYDTALAEYNIEYPTKRKSGRLMKPRILHMRKGWADRRRKREVSEGGKRDSQYKWCYIALDWDDFDRADVLMELVLDDDTPLGEDVTQEVTSELGESG